jgi:hypothetical protein
VDSCSVVIGDNYDATVFRSILEAAGYLSALIDGEGSVYACGHRRLIQIYNSDESIVDACLEACSELLIDAQARVRVNAAPLSTVPIWTVSIYGRSNLERAQEVLVLRSRRKQEALDRAVSSYARRRPVERWEFEEMLREGLTHREMARRLGYKRHATVQYHLRRLGLLTTQRQHRCRCRACTLGRAGFEEMLARGMTRGEIARSLGYKTQSAITYHFKRLQVNTDLHSGGEDS